VKEHEPEALIPNQDEVMEELEAKPEASSKDGIVPTPSAVNKQISIEPEDDEEQQQQEDDDCEEEEEEEDQEEEESKDGLGGEYDSSFAPSESSEGYLSREHPYLGLPMLNTEDGSVNLEVLYLMLMSYSFRITDLAVFGKVEFDKEA